MNRLHIRIYEPPAEETQPEELFEPRDIIPLQSHNRTATIISGRFTAPVDRARIIHDNSHCPECSGMDIEPLELQDAVISPKSRLPIPGTATIVGFHCNDCSTEWPVYELTTRRNG
ncbi:MAG: hypothetical protein R3C59_05695 [Planctomycetaceae bacterium]